MIRRTLIKGISIMAASALIVGNSTGIVANAEWTGTYDFNNTSWHTTTYGNDKLTGFLNINCQATGNVDSADIGIFPYTRTAGEDYAVELKTTTGRAGTGIGVDYGETKSSGSLVSEFEMYMPDFNGTRTILTRDAGGGTTISNIAQINKQGQLSVKNSTSSAIQLASNQWYTIRIVYELSGDKAKGGATTVDIYRDGVCIGHMNGTAEVPSGATNYSGSARYLCITGENKDSSTVIDNWKYEHSSNYRYLYEEFKSDFSDGVYVGGANWVNSDTNKTYTQENGYYKLKATNTSNAFNGEYTLNANSYFSTTNQNGIGVDFTVNFPDFNSEKTFMMRSSANLAYATVTTDGSLKFPTASTGLKFEKNTDYKVSFKYNIDTKYGYLTVCDTDGRVLYDSSKDTSLTTDVIAEKLGSIGSNAVVRVGFGIAKITGTSELWLNDLAIYQVANDSFPTQAVVGEVDDMTAIDLSTDSYTENSVSNSDVVSVTDGELTITLNDDDYAGIYTDIKKNNTANSFVIKGSVKTDSTAESAELAFRNVLASDCGLDVSTTTGSFVKFDNTTNKIYATDTVLLKNSDGKDTKETTFKEIGEFETNKWYDVTVVLDQAKLSYVVMVACDGETVAYGEGILASYDLPVQYLLLKNGNAGNNNLTNASVYFKNFSYGVIKTAEVPQYVSSAAADDLPLGAGVAVTFSGAVEPCSFVGMTANSTTVTADMITYSADGKTVYISGLEPSTEYTFASATVKSMYCDNVTLNAFTVSSGTYKNYVTAPIFTADDGAAVRRLRDITDSKANVSVKASATSGNELTTVNLLVAQYDADGNLAKVDVKKVDVDTTSSETKLSIAVGEDTIAIKAFLWDLTDMRPKYEPVVLN